MEKIISNEDAHYRITWSPFIKYDRHAFTRLMPVLPGIIGLFYKNGPRYQAVLFLECWRDGLRDGIKNFMDPIFVKYKELREQVDIDRIHVSYTVVESSPKDLADILYFLIHVYRPALNSQAFKHTGRYKNVYVSESQDRRFRRAQ